MRNLLRVWAFVGTQFIVSAPAIADAPDTLWTRTFGGTPRWERLLWERNLWKRLLWERLPSLDKI